MTRTDQAVVAVIGGGPAGASAALELARCGIETRLLERSNGSGNPVGECLAPSVNPLLYRLGLDEVMLRSGALPSYSNRSAWGGDGTPVDRDFLREALGHGWHLDRPAFNGALLDAVEAVGVPVWRQTRMTSLTRAGDTWEIGTVSPCGARTLHASMHRRCFGSRRSGRAAAGGAPAHLRHPDRGRLYSGRRWPSRSAPGCNDRDRGGGMRVVVRGAPA